MREDESRGEAAVLAHYWTTVHISGLSLKFDLTSFYSILTMYDGWITVCLLQRGITETQELHPRVPYMVGPDFQEPKAKEISLLSIKHLACCCVEGLIV